MKGVIILFGLLSLVFLLPGVYADGNNTTNVSSEIVILNASNFQELFSKSINESKYFADLYGKCQSDTANLYANYTDLKFELKTQKEKVEVLPVINLKLDNATSDLNSCRSSLNSVNTSYYLQTGQLLAAQGEAKRFKVESENSYPKWTPFAGLVVGFLLGYVMLKKSAPKQASSKMGGFNPMPRRV